jgi:folate-dependent tRNA-U54 methylase TrmFO/GidA
MMARQVRLSKDQFADLINCPLSKEEYMQMMKDQGYVKEG